MQIRFFFFPKEHVCILTSKEIKNITHVLQLQTCPHYRYQCSFALHICVFVCVTKPLW